MATFSFTRISLAALLTAALGATLGLGTLTTAYAAGPNIKAMQLYQQAVEANAQGKGMAALQLFESAAEADPNYPDTFFNLGVLQYQMGNYPKAKAAFERSVSLNAGDADAWYSLALTQEKLNQPQQAIATLQRIPATSAKYGSAQGKIATMQQQLHAAQQQQLAATQASAQPQQQTIAPPNRSNASVEVVAKDFSGPTGIAIGNDGTVFVANYSKNVIDRIGPDGKKTEIEANGTLSGPVGLVFHPQTQELFVANYLGNSITRILPNGQANQMITDFKKPYYLNLDMRANILYVSEQESNTLGKIKL